MIGTAVGGPTAIAQPVDAALIDAGSANDWLTYHGSYKSYHYSPLDQINAGNVQDLRSPGSTSRAGPPAACSRCRSPPTACSTTPAPTAASLRWTAPPAR